MSVDDCLWLNNEGGCLRVAKAMLAPRLRLAVEPVQSQTHKALEDYAKLLTDTALADVTFAVDGQRFPAHRCVLAARSPYFTAFFASGQGMREEGSRAAGGEIVLEEVSACEFERLLEYLYGNKLPEGEEWEVGPGPWEIAVVADRFQACCTRTVWCSLWEAPGKQRCGAAGAGTRQRAGGAGGGGDGVFEGQRDGVPGTFVRAPGVTH